MAANQIPDEIISEILSPLLKHSDAAFSEPLEKPFVDPGYSASSYLLVSRAWFHVSTPLLYSVVILRTVGQAQALERVLESNKELGLFVRKLRVEGGFGKATHTILKCSPKITDFCFSLVIWGSDDVNGLCRGLPLINPQRVILIDNPAKTKKNKKVEALLNTLLQLIPKWDNLLTFYLPYSLPVCLDDEARSRVPRIVSALIKSNTLCTLDMCAGYFFPKYLRPMTQAPSLKCIRFIRLPAASGMFTFRSGLDDILAQVATDPELKALVKVHDMEPPPLRLKDSVDDAPTKSAPASTDPVKVPTGSFTPLPSVKDILELEELGKASGLTIESLRMHDGGMKKCPIASPDILAYFPNLQDLDWRCPGHVSFATPAPGFSALPRLNTLHISEGSPSVFKLFSALSLDALRRVRLFSFGVAGADTFLGRHGPKLIELGAPFRLIRNSKVFDVCTNLTRLTVYPEHRKTISEDFFACAAPHTALAKIEFEFSVTERLQGPAVKAALTALDPSRFPVLKEIEFWSVKWPTSEQETRRSEWVRVSEILRPKGIRLVDSSGVGWTPRLKE
ncbi:hypothetical protein C8R43DRAFT_998271 [Mycena crocata]|nr:hypothetical protein C8R43DRAFT_998271 [Mycena crocata]